MRVVYNVARLCAFRVILKPKTKLFFFFLRWKWMIKTKQRNQSVFFIQMCPGLRPSTPKQGFKLLSDEINTDILLKTLHEVDWIFPGTTYLTNQGWKERNLSP